MTEMADMKEVRVRVKKGLLVMVRDNADLVDHDDHLRLVAVGDGGDRFGGLVMTSITAPTGISIKRFEFN